MTRRTLRTSIPTVSPDAMLAEAKAIVRDGRMGKLKQSLLRSAIERAEQGNFSDLAGRLASSKAEIARLAEESQREERARERELERLAQATAERHKTVKRVDAALQRLERERDRAVGGSRGVSLEGAFGARMANGLNDYVGRKAVLERAREIVAERAGATPIEPATSIRFNLIEAACAAFDPAAAKP